MAGGIFKDRAFHLNTKCIIFSLCSSLIYAAGGGKNMLLIALIFIISYVLLAWYDYVYDCNDYMFSGTGVGPSGIFKPQRREKNDTANDLVADQEQAYLRKVYFFHALMVAPLLIYTGFTGQQTHLHILRTLGGMGSMAFIYHALRIKYPREVWA